MTVLEAQWNPAKHLILGDDPEVRIYAEAVIWFKKIELFRKGEEERMFSSEPSPEDLAMHKALIQRLIADGEHLLLLAEQVGFPTHGGEFKVPDVAAALETLRDSFRGWHQPMPNEQRLKILKQVFPDVP